MNDTERLSMAPCARMISDGEASSARGAERIMIFSQVRDPHEAEDVVGRYWHTLTALISFSQNLRSIDQYKYIKKNIYHP